MSIAYDNHPIRRIVYGGNDIKKVITNGKTVFTTTPAASGM